MNPDEIKEKAHALAAAGASAEEIERFVKGATASMPKESSGLGGAVASLAQGATLGFADEALGAIEGLNQKLHGGSFKEGFKEGADKTRAVGKQFASEHPIADVGLQMAGGLVPSLATGGAASPSLARSIATGAGFGATAGAGSAEGGLAQRATGATFGGLLGGTVGAAVPIAGQVLGKGANVVKSVINRGGQPAKDRANAVILQALERDNVPVESLKGANPTRAPKMVLDMGGENLRGVARAAQGIPSEAKDVIPKALMKRHEGLGTRLGKDLEDALGITGEDVNAKAEDLLAARRANAQSLYEKAYAHGQIDDPRISKILELPDFKKAYQHARTIAQLEGVELPEKLNLSATAQEVLKSGSPEARAAIEAAQGSDAPTVQMLDYVKRAVDDMIKSGQHAPLEAGGLGATRSRALLGKQHELLSLIDEHVPDFAKAREQYAGDLSMEKALDAGRNFMSEDPATNKSILSKMTAGEKQTFRLGAIDNVKKEMAKAQDGADLTRRIFGTKEKRENINALFDDPKAANQFREWVKNEARLVRNKNAVLGNSSTAGKLAEMADLGGANIGDVAGSIVTGNPGRAVRDVFRMAAQNRLQGVSRNVADELAPRLTAQPGTGQFSTLLQELEAAAKKQQRSLTVRNAGTRSFAQLIGGKAQQ